MNAVARSTQSERGLKLELFPRGTDGLRRSLNTERARIETMTTAEKSRMQKSLAQHSASAD